MYIVHARFRMGSFLDNLLRQMPYNHRGKINKEKANRKAVKKF